MTEQTPPLIEPHGPAPRGLPAAPIASPLAATAADSLDLSPAAVAGSQLPARRLDECDLQGRPGRRVFLPAVLFIATCFTLFAAGVAGWQPVALDHKFLELVAVSWPRGLAYMACCMAVLLAHEMGHFLMALKHRVPASFPYFIPVPITAIGTMGAVIGMDGLRANRKQLFDIGLAGPLAGLVLTVPMVCLGIWTAKAALPRPATAGAQTEGATTASGDEALQDIHYGRPLLVRLLQPRLRPDLLSGAELEGNALYMAGWVGMLITGLNLLPVSQLDGGHVIYGLLGPRSRWFARATLLTVIACVIVSENYTAVPMIVLVILLGVDHPPSHDDRVRIGPLRWILGAASLGIPIFCVPVPIVA